MEKKNKECDIIADLLPIYLENVTKPETNCFIEEHLAECESCRQNYEWMKDSFTEAFVQDDKKMHGRKKRKARMFKKVKWKLLLYGYVCCLVFIWLYCVADLLFFF